MATQTSVVGIASNPDPRVDPPAFDDVNRNDATLATGARVPRTYQRLISYPYQQDTP